MEPDLRILQANERTLLAWIRTGLALMAFGILLARLSTWLKIERPEVAYQMVSTTLGGAILAIGTACHIIGAVRFVRARRAIVENRSIIPGAAGPVAIAVTAAAVGAASFLYAFLAG